MAVGSDKVMQDFDSELVPAEGHIPQVVKGPSVRADSGLKDCVNLSLPTAVSRRKKCGPKFNIYPEDSNEKKN